MRRVSMLGALALAALQTGGAALASSSIPPQPRSPRNPRPGPPVKRPRGSGGSPADQPHEHKREIARRLRQQERDRERQRERAQRYWAIGVEHVGLSRRGKRVSL